ncbi:hypothetical protein E2320_006013, partial [Naja naja]
EEECPHFLNPSPEIIPMEVSTKVYFEGKNLDNYQDRTFKIGNNQFEFETTVEETEDGKYFFESPEMHITFVVTLYSCSYGRDDCSLCLAADPQYQCVWCEARDSCVFTKRCSSSTTTCPAPIITQIEPKNGPLSGGILLTIRGSNLGINAEDVKEIMVANTECQFRKEFYSVSTKIVCEVGRGSMEKTGEIRVNINEQIGTSTNEVQFTYQ